MNSLPGILLLLSLVVNFAHSDKILVISFFSSKSHKITYMPLIEALAERGHEITIVTPVKGKETKNIQEIYTIDVDEITKDKFNAFEMREKGQSINPTMMIDIIQEVCEKSYNLPQVIELQKEKFDLIFMPAMFNDCLYGLVHKLKAPFVLFSPVSAASFMVQRLGGHMPPSFVPNPFGGLSDEMNFYQRFVNFGVNVFMDLVMRLYYDPKMEKLYRDILGQDIPSIAEINGNASLLLSNGHFSLSKPKPYLPDVVDVGGLHSHPAKPLPKDLEDFVSKGKDGFILFSMGSVNKAEQMSEDKRKMFINVFSKLSSIQVLWKFETEFMPDLPKNVKLSKWLPQQDLLGHPNIRCFITHCGGGSTEESIYHGVPLVGIPIFGDQIFNAKQAKQRGYLIELEWSELTEENLMDAIQEVLGNKKYKENVQRLSNVFKDQVNSPLERGVYWIEYLLRHKGAPHLRSASRKLNFVQYHSIDVMATYLTVILGSLYIIFSILRLILRKVCEHFGGNSEKKVVKNKKKN